MVSFYIDNIKSFIINWHILLILMITGLSIISFCTYIIFKLKKNKAHAIIFLLLIFSIIILLYWATTAEIRFLWLGYFLVYSQKYIPIFYECSLFFFKGIIFAIPNFFKILATCTPYEEYIFRGQYWLAIKLLSYDFYIFTTSSTTLLLNNLSTILCEGATYRLSWDMSELWPYFVNFDLFLINGFATTPCIFN